MQCGVRLHAANTSLCLAAAAGVGSAALLAMAKAARSRLVCSFMREERLNIIISSGSSAGVGCSMVGRVGSARGSATRAPYLVVCLNGSPSPNAACTSDKKFLDLSRTGLALGRSPRDATAFDFAGGFRQVRKRRDGNFRTAGDIMRSIAFSSEDLPDGFDDRAR